MPVSIVIGGQFGSEGKGKTALEIVRRNDAPVVVVRVGGPNSGHTAYARCGKKFILRQLPAGCVDRNVDVVLPAGSYIDVDVLEAEIALMNYPRERIRISEQARIIAKEHQQWEREAELVTRIGSTGSGVGGAVLASVARGAVNLDVRTRMAGDDLRLRNYVDRTLSEKLRTHLFDGHRIVVEGTQGFGLSLNEGGYWPKVTSRCTTAAGALAEAGLSPMDVDDVTMVIRSFPIRVAGDSGPLKGETNWKAISRERGLKQGLREFTSVTGLERRVGNFDPDVVREALRYNAPSRVVLNHLDYVGDEHELHENRSKVRRFIRGVEDSLRRKVDWFGFSGQGFVPWDREAKNAGSAIEETGKRI